MENLVLEKYSLQPYIENVEKGDNSKINEKFREIEPKEIELQKKIEKTEMMDLSPLDRLRKMGKPIVKLFVVITSYSIHYTKLYDQMKCILLLTESMQMARLCWMM